MDITGAELFVKALKEELVDTLFAYPGGQAIDLFDALYGEDDINVILPRHEQGLVHAADGYARSTGKVGVCLVTSGPGATNLVTGIATANYDSVPLVCFTGQVPTGLIGNDAFQEVDIVGITRNISKYAVTVRKREDLAATVKKAMDLLEHAKRPVCLIGGGVTISRANGEMRRLAEITGVPVVTTIMGKGAIPTTHDLYVGNIGIHGSYAANMAISECDVLFSIGTRFNDRITGKTEVFAPNAKMAINKLLKQVKPLNIKAWVEQIGEWKEKYPIAMKQEGMTPGKIIRSVNQVFDSAIITTDVGQNQLWATQFLELNERKQMLTSGDGSMQMNIQEMATAVVYELPVIICILNNGYLGTVRQWQEMFFDRRYASTCMRYRKSCATSCNVPTEHCPEYMPDFIKLAESYGAKGIRVTDEKDIVPALEAAKNQRKGPTVIEFIIDREVSISV